MRDVQSLATRQDIGRIMLQYGTAARDRGEDEQGLVDTFDDVTLTAEQLRAFLIKEQVRPSAGLGPRRAVLARPTACQR